jgi:primosomal protein N' (replication factor Y)
LKLHATVAIPVPLGQAFSYSVPDELGSRVRRGARVDVGDGPLDIPEEKLKPIGAVVDAEPVLPEDLLAFLIELSRYYFAPIGEVMRLALPAVERTSIADAETLELVEGTGVATVGRLVQVAVLRDGASPGELKGRALEVWQHVQGAGRAQVSDLEERFGSVRQALRKLEQAGLVAIEREPARADPFLSLEVPRDVPPELTDAQARAVASISARLDEKGAGAFLLHGVTASGKTEVYLRAVAHTLGLGGSALVLVPEIALTPQLVSRFRSRLGDTVAVLHSGLGAKDRHAMWSALRSGSLRVAVGARSALFAPVEKLMLVCVDEEHDSSFKQEEGVRYHARDMALLRAHRAGAVAVLGSATPSLASEQLVRAGKLTKLELPERARRTAVLPKVEIVDIRRMGAGPSGDRLLSLPLHRALERALEAGEQSILFLNRRGFAPSVVCDECGHVLACANCSVALTLHRARGNRLSCHYCDYSAPLPERCPECHRNELGQEGAGTERIENLLKTTFPNARVARLDRDVAAGLKSEAVLDRMRRREVDILVGTQMVTKGHDLPSVTLVGVLNADAALSMPDYQASERTFQLLVQVAGRAGRGDVPGIVMIQTRTPSHPAIAMAVTHDVPSFVERELEDRKELGYPPFSRLALVRIDAVDEGVARREADRLASLARRAASNDVEVVGPAPAPLARLRNRYRFRFIVRSASRGPLRRVLARVAAEPVDRRARAAIDVDPVNML